MPTEKEKMLAGENFTAIDPELTTLRLKAKQLLKVINTDLYTSGKDLSIKLKELLPNASGDIYIEPPFYCDYGFNIHAGKRVFFNMNCTLLDVAPIYLGSHVLLGPGVHIYTVNHPLDPEQRKKFQSAKPVRIGENCWIGGASIILPGVTIGENSVIGAGSVVSRDVPPNSLALGNPARVIKTLK